MLEAIGLVAAIGYAFVTYLQWKDLRHNFIVDQRPWLAMQRINTTAEVKAGVRFWAFTDMKNFGKTPANHVHGERVLRIICGGFPADPYYPHLAFPVPSRPDLNQRVYNMLMPGEAQSIEPTGMEHALTEDETKEPTSGRCQLYFYGKIEYCDIFGDFHYRHVCGQWLPGTTNTFITCGTYADGDEDDPRAETAP